MRKRSVPHPPCQAARASTRAVPQQPLGLVLSPCVEKDEQGPISEAWDVDPGLITKLKEQYRKERKGKKGVKSKSCQALLPPSLSSLCRA